LILESQYKFPFQLDAQSVLADNQGIYQVLLDSGKHNGKGRATDSAFIERLWRSVKYEHIYIGPHNNGTDLFHGLNFYFAYYNQKRGIRVLMMSILSFATEIQ